MAEKTGGKRRADGKGDSGDDGDKAKPAKGGSRAKRSGPDVDVTKVRSIAATVIWVLAVLAAAVLAIGALLIVLDFNRKNGVVDFMTSTADNLNVLGQLKEFTDKKGKLDLTKTVLVNWGICAVVYLVVGKVLEKLVRP